MLEPKKKVTKLSPEAGPNPRVLLLDIETRPAEGYFFGLFKQNIGIQAVKDPGGMMSIAAKWYDSNDTYFFADWTVGHRQMLENTHELLTEAAVVVHYNGESFDIPHINREFWQNDIPEPAPFKQVDLLKEIRRKFRFLSNKLDFVSQQVGVGQKVEHQGMPLWIACMEGDTEAQAKMREYNVGDVRLTERLFNKALPWLRAVPLPIFISLDDAPACRKCHSTELVERDIWVANALAYPAYQCDNCGGWSRGAKTIGRISNTWGL